MARRKLSKRERNVIQSCAKDESGPASAVCHKTRREISCKLEGDTSGSLAGRRRR